MSNLNQFTQLYRRYRSATFGATATRAADYARARMWLDTHALRTRNGEFCKPQSLADAERVGYTGVVWLTDDDLDVDNFYGFEEPLQSKLTKELRRKLQGGEWEACTLFLLVDGTIVDALCGIVLKAGDAATREVYELDMASEWVEAERSGAKLVATMFAL